MAKKPLKLTAKRLMATTAPGRAKLEYQAEQVIFSQEDAADSVFFILRGKIKIVVTSKQQREAVVALLGEGEFFGEGCLLAQPLRLAAAVSISDVTVMRIDKAEMMRLLQSTPHFSDAFVLHLLTRNSRFEADLADHLFNSSEKRLARVLLMLANFGKEGKPEPITAKISQGMLAEMIGTTRPRVSIFMNKFRRLGLIDYNGTLEVRSSLLNVILSD